MLSSASTDAQVWAAYDDAASFQEDLDVAKARAFVTACRILLRRRPTSTSTDGLTVAFDDQSVRDELRRAEQFVADAGESNAGQRHTRHFDLSRLRD
jgi:hypothetical protein